jgi:hypothetical protein
MMQDTTILPDLCDPYAEILEVEERLAEIRAERDTLCALLHAALDQLHALTVARDRDQARYLSLLDELRALRGTETRRAA